MSIEMLEAASRDLGPMTSRVAFLGGASVVLWITEPAAPPVRPTRDVDVIVEVASTVEYYQLSDELRARRFDENPDAGHIGAWRHRDTGLELDVMPTEASILGFTNQWYGAALDAAVEVTLPSNDIIRAVPPPFLLATKLEAFKGRGHGDYLASRDFGDVVVLIDGRLELVDEICSAPPKLRDYLAAEFTAMRAEFAFEGGVAGALLPDAASQARAEVVHERVQTIIGAGS